MKWVKSVVLDQRFSPYKWKHTKASPKNKRVFSLFALLQLYEPFRGHRIQVHCIRRTAVSTPLQTTKRNQKSKCELLYQLWSEHCRLWAHHLHLDWPDCYCAFFFSFCFMTSESPISPPSSPNFHHGFAPGRSRALASHRNSGFGSNQYIPVLIQTRTSYGQKEKFTLTFTSTNRKSGLKPPTSGRWAGRAPRSICNDADTYTVFIQTVNPAITGVTFQTTHAISEIHN